MDEGKPLLLGPASAVAGKTIEVEEGRGPDARPVAHVDLEAADPAYFLRELHPVLGPPKRLFRMPSDDMTDRLRDA
jgi:hypothetical protein